MGVQKRYDWRPGILIGSAIFFGIVIRAGILRYVADRSEFESKQIVQMCDTFLADKGASLVEQGEALDRYNKCINNSYEGKISEKKSNYWLLIPGVLTEAVGILGLFKVLYKRNKK